MADSISYNGTSGLLEMPNARIHEDFRGSAFYSFVNPYSNYGLTLSVLPRLEANARFVHARHAPKGDKNNKVLSIKTLLYPESEYVPSLAFGMDDIWGDLKYASKYLVMSKKISYFDLTLGYAVGRLAGSDSLDKYKGSSYEYIKHSSLKDGHFFGGAEFYLSKDLRLLAEYSPIDYELDTFKLKKQPKSRFNFGIKYDINKNFSTKLSLARGNQIGFDFAYNFDLSSKGKSVKKADNYSDDIVENLATSDFTNVKIIENKDSLWISASNDSFYDIDALAKVVDALRSSKQKYDYVYLDLKKPDKKVLKINTKELDLYKKKSISNTYMKEAVVVDNSNEKLYNEFTRKDGNIGIPIKANEKKISYDIVPSAKSYVVNNGRSLSLKAGVNANLEYSPFDFLSLDSSIYLPVFNNMNKLDFSDKYDKYKKVYLDRLALRLDKGFGQGHYASADMGVLSQKYTGINLEYQKSFLNDKVALSLQYQNAWKRKEDKIIDAYDKNYDAKFLNLYYQLSKQNNTHLGLRAGEFLNGDRGYRVELSRTYRKFSFGAYFSRTKKDDEKRNTKGFYVKIPLYKSFITSPKKSAPVSFHSLSNTINGDFIDFDNSLYNRFSNENNLQIIKKNIDLLKR
ncbi:MAG: YjbH domain-containing protein [Campylobacteraceae bacterium]|nr:YjbH domain-containing protein [Campylobacteraceae bacterium]